MCEIPVQRLFEKQRRGYARRRQHRQGRRRRAGQRQHRSAQRRTQAEVPSRAASPLPAAGRAFPRRGRLPLPYRVFRRRVAGSSSGGGSLRQACSSGVSGRPGSSGRSCAAGVPGGAACPAPPGRPRAAEKSNCWPLSCSPRPRLSLGPAGAFFAPADTPPAPPVRRRGPPARALRRSRPPSPAAGVPAAAQRAFSLSAPPLCRRCAAHTASPRQTPCAARQTPPGLPPGGRFWFLRIGMANGRFIRGRPNPQQ